MECNSFEELMRILQIRYENDSNEFELYSDGPYPFMTILAKNELACVHIFQSDEDPGHYARCDDHVPDREGITVFNSGSPTAQTEVSNELVIPFGLALEVAKDFFENREMSGSVEWFEL